MLNELSVRFLRVLEYLIKEEYISDNKDFASKISVSASMITEISKGRSNVGLTAIQNTVLAFPINSDWLLTGRGSMLHNSFPPEKVSASPTPPQKEPSILPENESFIYKVYKEKDNENKSLIEELGSLKERIRNLESKLSQYECQPDKHKECHPGIVLSEPARHY